jgi:CRISPR/Cas system-associated protein Cas7 (RAMP superfamily)
METWGEEEKRKRKREKKLFVAVMYFSGSNFC